jgi:hypothetical protein
MYSILKLLQNNNIPALLHQLDMNVSFPLGELAKSLESSIHEFGNEILFG